MDENKQRGGFARAEKLSPERRTEIARAAAVARWASPGARKRMARKLPTTVHGHCGGSHQVAIERVADIHRYVTEAVEHLEQAADETLGAHVRGGHLNEGADKLDAIIRFANCAKQELVNAHAGFD